MGELRDPSGEMFNENGAILVDDLCEDLSDEDEDDEGGAMVVRVEVIGV